MKINSVRWVWILFLPFLFGSTAYPSLGQNFGECQSLLKDLLPVFNKAFEENNPALLKDSEYQKNIRALNAAYSKYNSSNFEPSDSVQRMNNEAVLLALSGNYHKASRIMESLDLTEADKSMQHNRGLFYNLSGNYNKGRSELADDGSKSSGNLNILYGFGKQKKYGEGISFAETASAHNSKGKWNYNHGLIYKFEGKKDEAIDEFSAAIRQNDDVVAYRLQRGDLYMRMGQQKKAVKDFEKVARKHPKAQIRYANALLAINEFGRARAVFELYLETDDKTYRGDAYLGLAHSYYGLMKLGEAQRYYRLALTVKRENASVFCGLANIHLSNHEYEQAMELFEKVIQKDSSFMPAVLGRAVANYGLKKYTQALSDFKRAESAMDESNKFNADLFVCKGFSEYYLGIKKDAADDFRKAIKLDPARYEALAGMSSILIDEQRYAEAGQFLEKALRYEQKYDLMWSNYGNLLLHFDMFKKGFQVFRKAVGLNPQNVNAQNGWGVVLLENDHLDRAMTLFDSLLKENPELPFLHNNHGIVQAYIGNRHEQKHESFEANARYDGAFEDFKTAMEKSPKDKLYNVNVGNVYRFYQKYDEAKLSYQRYQDKSALNNTAVMYAAINKMPDAKYYLGVALEIDSLHRVFQYNMNVLVKGKQQEMMKLVASAGDDGPYGDIGIKYSLDGMVTIYLYKYEYDTLKFPGRHFMPLPVAEYKEDYFIPEYDFKLVAYDNKKKPERTAKRVSHKQKKVKMPGRKGKSGTQCPVLW